MTLAPTSCSRHCRQRSGSAGPRSSNRWSCALGQVLYESGSSLSHVYFPTSAIVSLLYVMENGASAEIAVVGNEGVVGVALFMGGETTPSRAVVQSAGRRLPAQCTRQSSTSSTSRIR